MKKFANKIGIDFETFYSRGYSLSKITTQEYVLDPRFEVVGVSVKLNDEDTEWFSGDHNETAEFLNQFPWDDAVVIAHNAMFDGAILEWRFGIEPAMYFCTMMGARPHVVPFTERGKMSLKAVAEYLGIGEKGTEVVNALGIRRANFPPDQLRRYAEYCRNDVDLCVQLYHILDKDFIDDERLLLDATIKKFTRPQFRLNTNVLRTRLAEIKRAKENALAFAGIPKDDLMSNNKFADALRRLKVVPPMKISPTTGKLTYAFAKSDAEFSALLDHTDVRVAALVGARLKVKSTQEETRIERFLDVAKASSKFDMGIGVPLLYYGAHTGRFSGMDKLNMQNPPRGSALRYALEAPEGHKVVVADLSQIEARITACLAGETKLVEQFANGEDVYSNFASTLFNMEVSKDTPRERFVGKTCILGLGFGVGTQKLYDSLLASKVAVSKSEAQRYVEVYRKTFPRIPQLWKRADKMIIAMSNGVRYELTKNIYTDGRAVTLPNGFKLYYPELRRHDSGWAYDSKGKRTYLYGAKLIENIVQALARIVVSTAEVFLIERGFYAALQVHDELVYIAPEETAKKMAHILERVMSRRVEWMPDLPLASEVSIGDNYGEAK